MLARISFAAIVVFFVTMNVLLWRSQSLDDTGFGNRVPVEAVWEKILSAPDVSDLKITHHGEWVGDCKWSATLGETPALAGQANTEEYQPEGIVRHLSGYTLVFTASLNALHAAGFSNRLEITSSLVFTPNKVWREFNLQAKLLDSSWEIRASARAQNMTIKINEAGARWSRTIPFKDLQQPDLFAQDLEGGSLGWLSGLAMPFQVSSISNVVSGLKMTASYDWDQTSGVKDRAYRLRARILNYRVLVVVSRVGEILRLELPDGLLLVNRQAAEGP